MAINFAKLIDIDRLSTFKTKLDLILVNKVDKVEGKGLSDTNFSQDEKTKLAQVEAGAQANVLEGVQINGDSITPVNKIANIAVPTNTSDLTNDSNFAVDANYVHTDNNYTSNEKNKLSGIDSGAQVNVLESIKVNGSTQTIRDKAVDITVPTALSDLTNDGDFVTDGSYVHTDNNYSTQEKTKLENIEAGAQVNVVDTIKVNGSAQAITNKAVNITVPTKTSDITNDSGFITASDIPDEVEASDAAPQMDGTAAAGTSDTFARGDHVHPTDTSRAPLASPNFTGTPTAPTAAAGTSSTQIATTAFVANAVSGKADSSDVYTKSEIDTKLSAAMHYKGTKATVENLPSTGNEDGDVWHVTSTGGEYAWNGTAWEELGSVIDLSGYVERSEITLATDNDINALFA